MDWQEEARQLARGLLEIAAMAMPDTYYASDSRCERARRVLEALGQSYDPSLAEED